MITYTHLYTTLLTNDLKNGETWMRLYMCDACGALIHFDTEDFNRDKHDAFHINIDALLKAND